VVAELLRWRRTMGPARRTAVAVAVAVASCLRHVADFVQVRVLALDLAGTCSMWGKAYMEPVKSASPNKRQYQLTFTEIVTSTLTLTLALPSTRSPRNRQHANIMAVLGPLIRLAEANGTDKGELEAAVGECMVIAKSQGQGTRSPSSSKAFPLGSGALGIGMDTNGGGGGGSGGGSSKRRGVLKKGGGGGRTPSSGKAKKRASFAPYLQ